MLVLARRVGEEIIIGEDIRVMVISIRSGCVRLGISAPPSIPVDRQEIREQRLMITANSNETIPVAAK